MGLVIPSCNLEIRANPYKGATVGIPTDSGVFPLFVFISKEMLRDFIDGLERFYKETYETDVPEVYRELFRTLFKEE